jgi:citrate synthase
MIAYRNRDLVQDLIGQRTFVEVFFYQTLGREATPGELRVVDAVLVVLMEHGLTPSVIAARLVYSSSPENIQAGVAAGLLAVGSQFVGTVEDCAVLLERIISEGVSPVQLAHEYRQRRAPVPGFGHHLHRPDDPRVAPLLDLGESARVAGEHVNALRELSGAVDTAAGRHITINATGAVAALLGDIGVPIRLIRGFALVSRAAGLVAHIGEEQTSPTGRFIWDLVDDAIPFDDGVAS